MSIVNAWQNKKKEDEEEKKVVGQQQKTQPNSDKPVGSTSIPKNNQGISSRNQESRTQSSAASSSRQEQKRSEPRREESKQNIIRRNTITANKDEQRQNNYARNNANQNSTRQTNTRQNTSLSSHRRPRQTGNNTPTFTDYHGNSLQTDSQNNYQSPRMQHEMRNRTSLLDDINSLPEAPKTNVPDSVIQEYSTRYGVSFDEAKQKFIDAEKMQNQTLTKPGELNQETTAKAQAAYDEQRRLANQEKINPWDAGMVNAGKTMADAVNFPVIAAGQLTGNDWDLIGERAREREKIATAQHPVASKLGDIAGYWILHNIFKGGSGGSNNMSAGEMYRTTVNDVLREGGSKTQALGQGLLNGLKQMGANLAHQAPEEIATDIFPSLANSVYEGKTGDELRKETVNNITSSIIGNSLGDLLSLGIALPYAKNANVIPEIGEQIVRNSAGQTDDIIPDIVNQVVKEEAPEVVEQAAKEAAEESIQHTVKEAAPEVAEDIVKNAPETPITPARNQLLGNQELFNLSDREFTKIAKAGGASDELSDLYTNIADALGSENPDDIVKAINDYRNVANANGVDVNKSLDRILQYSTGDSDINSGLYSVSKIYKDLDNYSRLDLTPTARKHLDTALEQLDAYEDALVNGENVVGLRENLEKSLANFDRNAKGIEGYTGDFGRYGDGTNRNILRGNEDYIKQPSTVSEADADSLVDDWIKNESESYKPARPANQIPDVEAPKANNVAPEMDIPKNDIPDAGATSENGKKISKWRTNTAENTGKIKNEADIPKSDYAHDNFSEEAQRNEFHTRYKDSKDVVGDIMKKDSLDAVDLRGAMDEWNNLMDEGSPESLSKANRLGIKISNQGREGGREIQVFAEQARNTPEGQLREAQRSIDNIADQINGKGTSEAMENLSMKIADAYENSKDVDEFMKKLSDLMNGNINSYVSKNTKEVMGAAGQSKKIKGFEGISKSLKNAKSLDDVNIDDIINDVYKANGGVKLSTKDQDKIYKLLKEASNLKQGSRAQEKKLAEAAKIVGNSTKTTFGDKFRAVIYANMLGNFKTAVSRNFFGNVTYQGLEGLRNPLAAGIDKLVSLKTGQHTTSSWSGAKGKAYAKGFGKGVKEQVEDLISGTNTGRSGALGWENALKNNVRTWNDNSGVASKFANGVEFYVQGAMKMGDRPFYEANYAASVEELHHLIEKYGKDHVAGFADIADEDVDTIIDMISSVRAADSVFQKHGDMSQGLTKLRDGLGDISRGMFGVDVLSTSASPFTMTPGNMIQRAAEYSPLGLLTNTVRTARELNAGNFNQRRFVDEASRTLLGLPILGGAYAGAKAGLINGAYSEDSDERQAQMDDNFIEYGLNIGDKTYDTSDLPVIGPFMQAGAAVAENGLTPESAMQGAEAVTLGSAMQGLNKVAGTTNTYSSGSSVIDNMMNTIKGAGTQLVPSLARQTAQTMDEYKRDLGEYGTDEYYLNSIINSIPKLRETLPVKTDIEGKPILQNQGRSTGEKILENYLYPMNVSEYKPSDLNKEASRLYEATGSAIGFPPKAKRSDLRKWDDTYGKEYSEKQYRGYKKTLGNLYTNVVKDRLIQSDFYKSLSATEQNKLLQQTYSGLKEYAKSKTMGIPTDDKFANAIQYGGISGGLEYLQSKHIVDTMDISPQSKAYANIMDEALNGNMESAAQKAEAINRLGEYGLSGSKPAQAYLDAIDYDPTLDVEEFAETYKAIAGDDNSIKNDEIIDYMNANSIKTQEDADKIWIMYGGSEKTKPVLKDGTWKTQKEKSSKTDKNIDSSDISNASTGTEKQSGKTSNNDFLTGNATNDARIKAKQAAQEKVKAEKNQIPEAGVEADKINDAEWQLKNGHNLKNTLTYQRAQAASVSDSDFLAAWNAADKDGNGYIKKAEAQAYVNALPKDEQSKWYNILYKPRGKKKKK